jgi:hypothetical protein
MKCCGQQHRDRQWFSAASRKLLINHEAATCELFGCVQGASQGARDPPRKDQADVSPLLGLYAKLFIRPATGLCVSALRGSM